MEQIKVSVIVPIYNADKYLDQCIRSILSQSLEEIEVILVDDGSTDNSLSICHSYKQKDRRVQVIHQVNQGVSAARNTGIKAAKGEFIAFVDADDWIDNLMYEDMYEQVIRYEAGAVICNYIEEHPNQKLIKSHHLSKPVIQTKAEREGFILNLIAGKKLNDPDNIIGFRGNCFYLYKRKEVQGCLFEREIPIGEDFLFNLNILSRLKRIAVVEAAYYHYRINAASSMQKYRKDCYKEQQKLIQAVEGALLQYKFKGQVQEKLEIMKLTYLITRVVNECHKDNHKSYQTKIETIKVMCDEQHIQELLKQFDYKQLTRVRRIWLKLYRDRRAVILYGYYRLKDRFIRKEGKQINEFSR